LEALVLDDDYVLRGVASAATSYLKQQVWGKYISDNNYVLVKYFLRESDKYDQKQLNTARVRNE
jgi:hypothetical protein